MDPKQFLDRLKSLTEPSDLALLARAESDWRTAMQRYKGWHALSNAHKHFFLETVGRLNEELRPLIVDPIPAQHAFLVERLVHNFQSLRAAEVCALNGYPLQGFILLRNIYDSCVLAVGAVNGLTDFERLAGIAEDGTFDPNNAKRNRISVERMVRSKIDGSSSGLSEETLKWLTKLDAMYDEETHAGLYSQSLALSWLSGKGALPVTPQFNETKAALFMNRACEVGWLIHKLTPLVQLRGAKFAAVWGEKWDTIDDSYRTVVMSLTERLGKAVGAAFCTFVDAKVPFTKDSTFPA